MFGSYIRKSVYTILNNEELARKIFQALEPNKHRPCPLEKKRQTIKNTKQRKLKEGSIGEIHIFPGKFGVHNSDPI